MSDLDATFARSHFPALQRSWTLFDNAGGSVAPATVTERVRAYMLRYHVQLGASYALSQEAGELVRAGREAAARLVNASPGEVILGSSTTANVLLLSRALRPLLKAGDEIVVTNLDHEANIGAWRKLEQDGLVIRQWRFDQDGGGLRVEDLAPLLNERTRLVCFTHCSNITGAINDVAGVSRRVHEAGGLVCVDGVAYAPHRRVDVKALGVDMYLASLYKTYGPHLGLLYVRDGLLERLANQNHYFLGDGADPTKLEPGGVNHELTSSLPGILDYLETLAVHHGVSATDDSYLAGVFELVARHEENLSAHLLDYLASKPVVRVVGPATPDAAERAPTISFVVEGRRSSELPPLLDKHRIAVRFGHFYAHRAIRDLDLLDRDGVVRVSMVHYNTVEEVDRLTRVLDDIL